MPPTRNSQEFRDQGEAAGIAKETEDFSGEMQSTTASWSWSKPGYNWSHWPWGANSAVLGSGRKKGAL